MQSQPLRAWSLGRTTSHMVPSLKSQGMTRMLTWQHFLEVRLGTCVESWVEQKVRPNPQHKPREHFCKKQSRSELTDNQSHSHGFLRLVGPDFASILELANMSETCDLETHVNEPYVVLKTLYECVN